MQAPYLSRKTKYVKIEYQRDQMKNEKQNHPAQHEAAAPAPHAPRRISHNTRTCRLEHEGAGNKRPISKIGIIRTYCIVDATLLPRKIQIKGRFDRRPASLSLKSLLKFPKPLLILVG
jgi:hypothetical protein